MKRILTGLLCAGAMTINAAPANEAPVPMSSVEPIFRCSFADSTGFKSIGQVTTGIELTGDDLAASLACRGDGKVARFDGGHLLREDLSVLLQGLPAFTIRLRLKPERDYLCGTLLLQRGACEPGSAAFDVSAWAMPFIEREHLSFQGMIEGGIGVGPASFVPSVNVDQDRHPIPTSGWRDIVIIRAVGGPLRLYLDGRLVAERSLACNVPGVWAFAGPRTPLIIGANAAGGDAFRGWMDEVTLWNRALDGAELSALAGGQPPVNAIVKQPQGKGLFGTGVLAADTPVAQRYDWIDAKLPAFRDHLEKTDPHYPRYHLTLPGEQWNPIAFFHGGKYHLFLGWSAGCFRYFEDTNENIVWQHLVSEDLITWQILPLPIRSPLYPIENGTFFVNDKGEVVTFYHGDRGDTLLMAVSRDPELVKWESFPDLLQVTGAPPEMKVRNDPSAVFKRGDTWYQVCTTVRPQARSMALPLYKSHDLVHWEYAGVFFEDATGRPINECGQLFQIDGRDVFTSIHNLSTNAQYMTGKIRADGTFERQYAGVVDYASLSQNCISTAVNDAGQATMWRNIQFRSFRETSAAGWRNTYGGPRDLRLDDKGRILVRPASAMEKLRGKSVSLEKLKAASSEIRLQFKAGTAGETGIRLTDGTKSLEARYDHRTREVQLDLIANADIGSDGSRPSGNRASIRRAPLPMKPGEPVTLRLFSDRSIFEIYANNEIVISIPAFFPDPENLKAHLFDRNGSKTQLTVDAWEMQPLKWTSYEKTKAKQ